MAEIVGTKKAENQAIYMLKSFLKNGKHKSVYKDIAYIWFSSEADRAAIL